MAGRLLNIKFEEQNSLLEKQREFSSFFKKLPQAAMLLNDANQIVLYSEGLKKHLQINNGSSLLGLSAGELIKCENAGKAEAGCGTFAKCKSCNIRTAIAKSKAINGPASCRCSITTTKVNLFRKQVYFFSASPFYSPFDKFTLCYLDDISEIKHIHAQEHSFFHDLLNTVGNLMGAIDLAEHSDEKELRSEGFEIIREVIDLMLEEIKEQKDLLGVESGEYKIVKEPFIIEQLLDSIKKQVHLFSDAAGVNLVFKKYNDNLICESDQTLLRRVIINCLKIAISESNGFGEVQLDYSIEGDTIIFKIKNEAFISMKKQLMLFQRILSSGEKDCCMGSYRILAITEKYLDGYISFETSESNNKGTTISIRIPLF